MAAVDRCGFYGPRIAGPSAFWGPDMDDNRFERLERSVDKLTDKIDDLTKVVVDIAKLEEQMITLFRRMDKYDDRQDRVEDRVAAVEKVSVGRGIFFRAMDKGLWLVIGAVVAGLVARSFGG